MKNYLFLVLISATIISCKKSGPSSPVLSNTTILVDKSSNIVTVSAEVLNEGGSATTARGFCWGTNPNPSISDNKAFVQYGIGKYSYSLTNLQLSTTYYVRAYSTNAIGTSYGSEASFKTLSLGKVTTSLASEITNMSAKIAINIDDFGDAIIKKIGAVYSTRQNAIITNDSTTYIHTNITDKNFTTTFQKLTQNTVYYVKGFVQSGAGIGYGNEISFKTNGVPTLSTNSVASITQTTALLSGDVQSDGGDLITEIGVCMSKSQNPTINDLSFKSTNLNMNKYSVTATGLIGNTRYYVRGYAKNKYGVSYGPESSFLSGPVLASISSTSFNSATIYSNKATYGATIVNNGGSEVIEIGLVASLKTNPTISDKVYSSSTITNSFSITMTGLINDTIYYTKPYVKNSVGITYGDEISFRTGYKAGYEYGPAGGLIIYTKPTKTNGWRYIEVSLTDLPDGTFLSTDSFVAQLGSTLKGYGDGLENTLKLIEICGEAKVTAAKACLDYKQNTYDDWYLPSIDELTKLAGFTSSKLTNSSLYYSSTFDEKNRNYGISFIDKNYANFNPAYFVSGIGPKVRPVRRF